MDDGDDVILETKRLAGVVGDTMAAVSPFLEDTVAFENLDPVCKAKCVFLRDSESRLRKLLMDSLWAVKHRWNEITGNEMLLADVRAYLGCCRDFEKVVWEFDDLVHRRWYKAEQLFGTSYVGRQFLSAILTWEKEAKAILDYVDRERPVGLRLDDAFKKAADRLRTFFEHVTATALQNFVMNGVSLTGRPRWKQDKSQAVVMGKMLGKSCKEMNESFRFQTLEGKPTRLNYTSHRPVLEYNQYEIYPIIREMLKGTGRIV